jgi:hypothetical protein
MSTMLSAGARNAELTSARLGVIHFLSTLQVNEPELSDMLRDASRLIPAGSAVLNQVLDMAATGGKKAAIGPKASAAVNSINQKISNWLADKFGASSEDVDAVIRYLERQLPSLIESLQEAITKEAGKALGGGILDVGSNLLSGITATISYYELKDLGTKTRLEPGHPALLAEMITKKIGHAALIGLAEAAKQAVQTTLGVVSAGASLIVEIVVGVITAILKFAVRLAEALRLTRLFAEAKKHWERSKGKSDGLHQEPEAFQEWFGKAIESAPISACLVMNSHVAGGPTTFLQIMSWTTDDDPKKIQNEFDAGVVYLNKLKETSARLFREYKGNEISSSNPSYKALLEHAKEIDLIASEGAGGLSGLWGLRAYLFKVANGGGKVGAVGGFALRHYGQQSTVHRIVPPKK